MLGTDSRIVIFCRGGLMTADLELLLLEIESLKQQLAIAAHDISELDGSDPNEYLHDLATRDFIEEIVSNKS